MVWGENLCTRGRMVGMSRKTILKILDFTVQCPQSRNRRLRWKGGTQDSEGLARHVWKERCFKPIFTSVAFLKYFLKMKTFALAGVAQWIECWPVNQRATGLIPSQGTCLGCGPGPLSRAHVRSNHMLIFLSLSFSLPPLFLKVSN